MNQLSELLVNLATFKYKLEIEPSGIYNNIQVKLSYPETGQFITQMVKMDSHLDSLADVVEFMKTKLHDKIQEQKDTDPR